MGIKKLHLSPSEPQKLPSSASTIALVGGDAPWLNIRHRNGKMTRLNVGQCLPINDSNVLINPFDREVQMDVVYNGRVKFDYENKTDAKVPEIAAITYHGGINLDYDGVSQTPSAYIAQLEGRALINVARGIGSNHKFYLAYDVQDSIHTDPSFGGFIDNAIIHSSKDPCKRTILRSGLAANADMNAFVSEVGNLVAGNGGFNIILPEKGQLFIVGDDTKDLRLGVRVLDYGVE